MNDLNSKRAAIVATNGFEESELFEPLKALKEEGIQVEVISTEKGEITAWNHGNWSEKIAVDRTLDEAVVEDGNLITSRNPGDLEAFNDKIIQRLKGTD